MSPKQAKQRLFEYWDYIGKLAERRFAWDAGMKEQAINYVLDKLSENDWQRVCTYEGKGFTAFITLVVNRLLTDFARKTGDSHPVPERIRKRGWLWQKAWVLLCLKEFDYQTALQSLKDAISSFPCMRESSPSHMDSRIRGNDGRDENDGDDNLDTIITLMRDECPQHKATKSVGGGHDEDNHSDEAHREKEADYKTRGFLMWRLIEKLYGQTEADEPQWMICLRKQKALTDEEYLLLRLVYSARSNFRILYL